MYCEPEQSVTGYWYIIEDTDISSGQMLGSLLSNKISEPCSPKDQTSSEDLVSYFQRLTAIMWEPNKPNLHLMISPSIPQCLPSWRRFNFIISQTVLICYTGGLRAWGAKKRHLRLKAPLWLPAEREDHWRSTVWPAGESAQETQEMHRESWADKYTFYYCYFIASCIQKRIKRYDFQILWAHRLRPSTFGENISRDMLN